MKNSLLLHRKLSVLGKPQRIGAGHLFMLTFYFSLCVIMSTQFEVYRIFIPLNSERVSVNVRISSSCIYALLLPGSNTPMPKQCLSCTNSNSQDTFSQCFWGTSPWGAVEIAKKKILTNTNQFQTIAFVRDNKAYLEFNPFPAAYLHIGIFLFGVLPIIAAIFSHKRQKKNDEKSY